MISRYVGPSLERAASRPQPRTLLAPRYWDQGGPRQQLKSARPTVMDRVNVSAKMINTLSFAPVESEGLAGPFEVPRSPVVPGVDDVLVEDRLLQHLEPRRGIHIIFSVCLGNILHILPPCIYPEHAVLACAYTRSKLVSFAYAPPRRL